MRKTLITITMGLALLPQMSKAQVYDEEKRLQWRSMETGPLEFEPGFTTGCSITAMPIMSGNGSGMDCSIADSI